MTCAVITDNRATLSIAEELRLRYGDIDLFQSRGSEISDIPVIDVSADTELLLNRYRLVLSVHCRQIFPQSLVARMRCINVHPGYNPFNRGWFPHVFSIINGLRAGVTIHEMTPEIDAGPIIAQAECLLHQWDTSETAYRRILELERLLLLEWYPRLRDNAYTAHAPQLSGNFNRRADWERIRVLDLARRGEFREFLDLLRAMSHGEMRNAYFVDETGTRVFVRVHLDRESQANSEAEA